MIADRKLDALMTWLAVLMMICWCGIDGS